MRRVFIFTTTAIAGSLLFFLSYLASHAGGAVLSLSPDSGTYQVGQEMTLDIFLDTGGNKVDGVSAFLSFDTEKLEFVSTDSSGSAFDVAGFEGLLKNLGFVEISRGASTGVSGSKLLVSKIVFRVLDEGTAEVNISSDDPYKSIVVKEGGSEPEDNILASATGGSYTLSNSTPQLASPENAEGAAYSACGIRLSWEWGGIPQSTVRFVIEQATDNSFNTKTTLPYTLTTEKTGNAPPYQYEHEDAPNLNPNSNYFYRLRTEDPVEESSIVYVNSDNPELPGPPIKTARLPDTPPPPENLRATIDKRENTVLTWTMPSSFDFSASPPAPLERGFDDMLNVIPNALFL